MNIDEWDPIYAQILRDFGFTRAADERAARILSDLLAANGSRNMPLERLDDVISGRDVIVCGKAPTLLKDVRAGKISANETVIAADGATSVLLSQGVIPAVIVSDLDGAISDLRLANAMCAALVVHAHGDNIDKLEVYVPLLNKVLGTTQTHPLSNVFNFGGFTDGDRAIFLAEARGARRISAIGFDFSDRNVTPVKMKKLKWAKRLLKREKVYFK
ncbi:MAG: 6-hydroxymethylpterin diphosphokinase MptE-like protein [Halobacteriota archaeon]